MILKKLLKGLLSLAILSPAFVFGSCNGTIREKENAEMVRFPLEFYNIALDSVPGQPIVFTMDDATFSCHTDAGSFHYYHDVKEVRMASGELFYCPHFSDGESFSLIEEDSYVDVKVYLRDEIVGYSVIKIINEYFGHYTPELLVAHTFVDKDDQLIGVDEDYVNKRIQQYHER